jgi:hypothetical protein
MTEPDPVVLQLLRAGSPGPAEAVARADCARMATLAAAIRGTSPAKVALADDTDPLAEVR